jgi:hypothetical protein
MVARDADGRKTGRLDEHGAVQLAPRVPTARATRTLTPDGSVTPQSPRPFTTRWRRRLLTDRLRS